MKISEAKSIYSPQLKELWERKGELTKLLKDGAESGTEGPNYDRVELTQELSQVEKQYNETQAFMDRLREKEMLVHNAEAARQQGESMADAMDDMIKCLEIARRISEGAKVPSIDENKLLEYSPELYMSAKNMAFMNEQAKRKEYDALTEEEEAPEDKKSAAEIAGDTEVGMELPEVVHVGESPAAE